MLEPIIFSEKKEAIDVLESMREIAREYGNVSVLEMFELAGRDVDFTWRKYGWTSTDLVYAHVIPTIRPGRYKFDLPLHKRLDN